MSLMIFFNLPSFTAFLDALSFNDILALTPSLLFFFYLRGESERGSWSPDSPPDPPLPDPTAPLEVFGWPQKSMEHISKNYIRK